MKNLFILLALVGGGLIGYYLIPQPEAVEKAPNEDEIITDPYEGWDTIEPGGIVSLRIPPGCTVEGAAGSTFVACGQDSTAEAVSSLVVSSDGITVNIRHGQDVDWQDWDKTIASLEVMTPIRTDEGITMTVEK